MLFSISNFSILTSQKLTIQSVHMTGIICEVVTPKDKTKSTTLANQKVRSITKSVVSFYSLLLLLRGPLTPEELPAFL